MARVRAGGLSRKTGINPVPIIIFILIAVVAGAGLYAWDYAWRRRQEAATKPPPPDVLVRSLIENIIGRQAVKAVALDAAAGTVSATFESATFKPEEAEKDRQQWAQRARQFLTAEARLASDVILQVPEPIRTQVPAIGAIRKVTLTIVYRGATVATAVAERGKEIRVTFVDSRLK
ncbi:MAG: hypothetical protein QN152_10050 [Armatimonadota bacterium]|nr:hypothetical protein [Armatimonadota bacterium]MDR7427300.1 hypothetical protein [Armatimonadota bacterium]MDR7463880.1 hypothetical protein [Armatimonadota bacterium]MDR7469922.1 hypothetical protein [Armatimonadota bacterium]MDR7474607.1 hypothetical protein [Armatimonadota bacterium]